MSRLAAPRPGSPRRGRRAGAALSLTVVVALLVGVSVTPAWASPEMRAAAALAQSTADEALRAASATQLDSEQDASTKPSAPVAEGTITPNAASTLDAKSLGTTVDFSGHGVKEKLDVAVATLPDSASASVASETADHVLTAPFQVSATTASGDSVTSFPADPVIDDVKNGPDVVTDVTPGVSFDIDLSASKLEGIDPGTVRIVTRENPGDPWTDIPSYYDADSGSVKGEIDHLSQFAVIGTPFVPPAGPRIVLDPDDDVAHTIGPNGPATELPYNVALANQMAAQLTTLCNAQVLVTRPTASPGVVSTATRAGMAAAFTPDVTLTIAFDALNGFPWGVEGDGGSKAYSRGGAADNAVRDSLVSALPGYTGRPAAAKTSAALPYSAFDSVPGAVAHLETLYLDHNYDRPVIDNGFSFIVSGVSTGLGMYLETKGFDCTDPVTGGWPSRPSAAQLAQWKAIGYHNFQTYGADPVSFSTGNLLENEPIFTLDGPGSQSTDLALVYNSQDGRESRVGTGWSFGLGARAQRFSDGSVLVVQGDGASNVFEPDGAGGYLADDGVFDTLAEAGGGRLLLTSAKGEKSVFDASDIDGIGELASYTDAQGHGYSLGYGTPDGDDRFVPLTSITDAAGQTIAVTDDAAGRIASFRHPDGRTWSLGYSAAGDLASITDPLGRVRSFDYDNDHRMLHAVDAAGITYLVNQYDSSGRVVKQWDADNNLRTFDYQSVAGGGGSTTYSDNEGKKSVFAWDDQHRITSITDALGGVESFAYDADGNTTKHTDQNGNATRYAYDANGNVTKQTAPDGTVRDYTYTPTGVLASTTDEGGPGGTPRTTTYEVDANGLVTAAHLPDGGVVRMAYTAAGDLSSLTDQAGKTTSFAYDTNGNLTRVTDPLGQATNSSYDSAGRLLSTTDPSGATTSLQWDAANRLVQTTDPLGGVTKYTYDADDHITSSTDALGNVTGYTWDAMFHLVAITDPKGAVTKYTYDSEDNLTSVTDPTGAVTKVTLDALGRPVAVTDADGKKWLSAYDAAGQLVKSTNPAGAVTSYVYDTVGEVTKVTDPSGAATTSGYDAVGRISQVTDALGGTQKYGYTALDQLASVTDQTGAVTSYSYDATGNQVGVTDRRGQKWTQSFDALARPLTQTDPTGGTTSYAYDTAARLVRSTDALGATSVTAFDALGRPVSRTDPLGAVTTAVYDALGRPTQTTDANGGVTKVAYDPLGNVTSLTDPLGATTGYNYDAANRVTTMTDPLGVKTAYRYDPLGQLTDVLQGYHPLPATVSGSDVNAHTAYGYTSTGQLASSTDPNGHTTAYSYDIRDLQTAETNPLGITTHTQYDALGRPVATTDGAGATTRTEYTPRSDVSKVSYPDGVTVGYQYDSEQNPIVMTDSLGTTGWSYDASGRVTNQTDPNGAKLGYSYDVAGQLTGQSTGGQKLGFGYDAAGRVSSQSSPWGTLGYSYDPAGNLTQETRSSGVTTSYGYDKDDRVTSIVHQTPAAPPTPASIAAKVPAWNGDLALDGDAPACDTNTVKSYFADRVTPGTDISGCEKTQPYLDGRELPNLKSPVPSAGALSYDYSYDAAGNVVSQTQKGSTAGTATTAYQYDALDRLTQSSGTDGTNSYSYDSAGNRTKWVASKAPDTGKPLTVSATFDAANDLTSETRSRSNGTTTVAYAYNGNGQRTTQAVSGADGRSTTSYAYTAAGQLAKVTDGSLSTSYRYDGMGRNLDTTSKSSAGTESTTSVWDGLSVVQQSSSRSGTSTLLRDVLGQVALQSTAPGGASADAAWSLQDRSGSTVAQTTQKGAVTDLTSYSDFGVPNFGTTGFSAATGYTGEQTDATTGLNTYFSRAYDPFAATWLSQDSYRGTLTDPQTQNRTAYVGGNPTTGVDTLGFSFLDSLFGAAKAVVNKVVSGVKKAATAVGSFFAGAGKVAAQSVKVAKQAVGNGVAAAKQVGASIAKTASGAWKDVVRHVQQINWQDVGAIAAGIVAGVVVTAAIIGAVACTAATVGLCAAVIIGATVIGGAVGSRLQYDLSSGPKTEQGRWDATVDGAASGLVGGTVGEVVGPLIRAGGTLVTKAATSSGTKAMDEGISGLDAEAGQAKPQEGPTCGGVNCETNGHGLDATEFTMTDTVAKHVTEYAKDGTLARPYADSRLTMQNIMDSGKPTADPGGVPGALRWDVPGALNGSEGTWELVVDPNTNKVLHYLFKGAK